ncbi:hypothetical protein M885DRAFT_619064, partial [Pelagophyceae sp. CCMP2097]
MTTATTTLTTSRRSNSITGLTRSASSPSTSATTTRTAQTLTRVEKTTAPPRRRRRPRPSTPPRPPPPPRSISRICVLLRDCVFRTAAAALAALRSVARPGGAARRHFWLCNCIIPNCARRVDFIKKELPD